MIELQNAEKLYGRTRAQQLKQGRGFRDVTLSIPEGQSWGCLEKMALEKALCCVPWLALQT